jgi:hypothetical protein
MKEEVEIKIITNEFHIISLLIIIISPARLIVGGHDIFLEHIKNHINVIDGMNVNIPLLIKTLRLIVRS